MSVNPSHASYRPDIDGLRAIAVLSVVLFHGFPQIFKGGFIGVDIFFVLSGYLISRIIFEQLNQGRFNFFDFYSRRIKRIFPALIVVLATFLALGFYLLLDDEYQSLGRHVFASSFFVNNFVLMHEAGYFDRLSDLKPLLHLWSLGIEEQFYLLWPLLIWCLFQKKIKVYYGIFLVIVVTFIINLLRVQHHGVDAFYSPQTRFWELGLGGLLAYASLRLRQIQSGSYWSIIAFALLILGMFFYHQGLDYPSWYAFLPLLATILLIAFPGYVNQKYLSHSKVVWLGRVSYPLYLWHWGLLSIARIIYGGKITNAFAFLLVLISLGLSVLTYRYIENPIRQVTNTKVERWLSLLLLGLLLTLGFLGKWIFVHHGLKTRAINLAVAQKTHDLFNFDEYKKRVRPCSYLSMQDGYNRCYISHSGNMNALIWGDSHAEHLFPGMIGSTPQNWLLLSRSSCPPFLGVRAYHQGSGTRDCFKNNNNVLNFIQKHSEIHTVMLSFLGLYYLSDEKRAAEHVGKIAPKYFHLQDVQDLTLNKKEVFVRGLEKTVQALLKLKKDVVIVEDIPLLPFIPTLCIKRPGKYQSNLCKLPKGIVMDLQAEYHEILLAVQQKYPEVRLVNAMEAICDAKTCPVVRNGHLLYRDSHHLSLYGSKYVAKRLFS